MKRRTILVLAAGATLSACSDRKPAFKSIDITGAAYARQFDLPDANGKPRSLPDFKGKLPVVFFGYTQCPDVCPTTMAEIAQARATLGTAGADVLTVFVTIDPERDTPEVLKAYVSSFAPDAIALRGSLEQTQAMAREFKVFFAKVAGQSPESYTMDHTAGAYVFDRQGRVRLFVRSGGGADALAQDLKLLIDGA
jgi:protein SCO1